MSDNEALPEKIRRLREEAGWSQQKLADRAGVARGTIIGLETGRNQTSSTKMRRITAALGGTELNDARQRLTAIGELHAGPRNQFCTECGQYAPCRTRQLLDGDDNAT